MSRDRHRFVLTGSSLVLMISGALISQSARLVVERRGDRLRVSAPQVHFLEGSALERLHSGVSVTYELALALKSETAGSGAPLVSEQFVVSYDLWEERFSVVPERMPTKGASHLTAAAAEAWCLDSLPVPIAMLPKAKSFVLKLECSVAEEETPRREGSSGLSLEALIDVLSRRRPAPPLRWEAFSGPVRLADLQDTIRQ